jgi:fermentation-respiration switch protein FrsA (DUF1100 family)
VGRQTSRNSIASYTPFNKALIWLPFSLLSGFEKNGQSRVKAPLLVIHGANDPRVPVDEAEQIVAALRNRNVPVQYLRYEDEGHGLSKLANRLDAYAKMADFLDQHM